MSSKASGFAAARSTDPYSAWARPAALALVALLGVIDSSVTAAREGAPNATSGVAPPLVYFDEPESAQLLAEATAKAAFSALVRFYVSERMDTYCSVASGVMVLNALRVPSPPQPLVFPYHEFDQDNFFDEAVLRLKPAPAVAAAGMTLGELAEVLRSHGLQVDVHHASATPIEQFRTIAREAAARDDRFVVVNLWRAALGQAGPGHFSPIAAYHAASDRFLVMDVARYKYAPWWVDTKRLWTAMNTVDPAVRKTRGFLVVRRGSSREG